MIANRKIALFSLASVVLIGAAACKKRNFNTGGSGVKAYTPSLESLDSNDVSILFPLPSEISRRGELLSLSSKTASGREIVPEALFRSVIEKSDYTKLADASKRKGLKSGIIFSGERPAARLASTRDGENPSSPFKGPFSFDDYAKWHIVAMRFDPCAPTRAHNRLTDGKAPLPQTFSPDFCTPQMRLTAQPLIARSDDPPASQEAIQDASGAILRDSNGSPRFEVRKLPVSRPNGIKVGDYAMHLAFTLTPEQAKAFALGLLEWKKACKGLGDGLPVSVNPCLQAEVLGATGGVSPSRQLKELILANANKLEITAFMGTLLSMDPWMFYQGTVSGNEFTHLPVSAVRIGTDEPPQLSSSTGKPLPRSFDDGMFQMLTLLMARTSTTNEKILAQKSPVVPSVRKSKVNDHLEDALRAELISDVKVFDLPEDQRMKMGEVRASQSLKSAGRILDPHTNDALSSDCVSCHVATRIFVDNSQRLLRDQKTFKIRPDGAKFLEQGSFFDFGDGQYASMPGLRQPVDERYNVMQFSYFEHVPVVSMRTAAESALAAEFANKNYLNLTSKRPTACDPRQIFQCHVSLSPRTTRVSDPNLHSYLTKACMQKACPDVLAANIDAFPKPVVLEASKNVKIFPWAGAEDARFACELAKGSRIAVASQPSKESDQLAVGEDNLNRLAILPLRGIPSCGLDAYQELFVTAGEFVAVNDPSFVTEVAPLSEEAKSFEECGAVVTTRTAPVTMGGSVPGSAPFMLAQNTVLRLTRVVGDKLEVESLGNGIPGRSLVSVSDATCTTASGFEFKEIMSTGSDANLRKSPAKDAPLVATVSFERIRILMTDATKSWFFVQLDNGKTAWTNRVNLSRE